MNNTSTEQIFRDCEARLDKAFAVAKKQLEADGFHVEELCSREKILDVGSFTSQLEWGFRAKKASSKCFGYSIAVHLLFLEPWDVRDPLFFLGRVRVLRQTDHEVETLRVNKIGGEVGVILEQGLADYVTEQFEAVRREI